MEIDLSEEATGFGWSGDDEPSAPSRSDRDRRAINLACDLLMVGVALERQVITLVKARSRG
jgi:hypothetical protein